MHAGQGHLRSVPEAGVDDVSDLDESDLFGEVRATLRESHPLPLLAWTSSLLAVIDPRTRDPFDRGELQEPPTRDALLGSFLDERRPETSALLEAVAALIDDELAEHRIRRELADRPGKPPRWLRRLAPPRVLRTVEMSHVLGDGDNIMLDVRTGNDDPMTVVAYIDHNLGTLVKDAFVIDEPLATVQPQYEQMVADEPDAFLAELDPADARVRITEAIELAAITHPPLETETWPACRALVEWVVRHLPTGGTGYDRPAWSEQERDELAERFLASPLVADLPEHVARDLTDVMVWFACDHGPGDPLRWSMVSVEIFLTDFLLRKAMLPRSTMLRAPQVLEAFVRFAHDERDIRQELTAETLAGVQQHTSTFLSRLAEQDDVDSDDAGRQLIDLLMRMSGGAPLLDDDGRPFTYEGAIRRSLAERVGGEEALATLDTEPLPDEPLDLDRVPDDVHDRVRGIAAMTDACCEELLDLEHRTACRRLLADVAAGDPAIFRRRSRDDRAAAAVAWVVCKANDTLEPHSGGLAATELVGWFGVDGSVSQRAATMLGAIDLPGMHAGDMRMGTTRYLVSAARAEIIERRDRLA